MIEVSDDGGDGDDDEEELPLGANMIATVQAVGPDSSMPDDGCIQLTPLININGPL